MNKERQRTSGFALFLTELLLGILIFAIVSAICLSAFSKSHEMKEESAALRIATANVGNAAEIIRSSDGLDDANAMLEEAFGKNMPVYFDEDGNQVESAETESAKYMLSADISEDGGMLNAEVEFAQVGTDESIYSTSVKNYIGEEASNE